MSSITSKMSVNTQGPIAELGNVLLRMEKFGRKNARKSLRLSLAIVFVWFGGLKLISMSPAEDLVMAAAEILIPFEFTGFLYFLGVWEVLIGLLLLSERTKLYGSGLFFLQMIGAMSPLVILPELCFTQFPFQLTLEGQYIIKNAVLIAAVVLLATQAEGIESDKA